jgi:hypothetical protein
MIIGLFIGEANAAGFGVHIMMFPTKVLIALICRLTLILPALAIADRRQIRDNEALPHYPIKGKEVKEGLLRISVIFHAERFI